MSRKLAVKRLTASDLTLFEWHFRNQEQGGHQKAINLNRDVFIDEFFPSMPEVAPQHNNRIPLDLHIYGPGLHHLHNVQRKIIKQPSSYKNWRLDGEFIHNPIDEQDRYNKLQPGDFAIVEFVGDAFPTSAKMVLVAGAVLDDQKIHKSIDDWLGDARMAVISPAVLEDIINKASPSPEHPIYEVLLDSELEDASLGGYKGASKLYTKYKGKKVSKSELQKSRRIAEDIGRQGEECLSAFFEILVSEGKLLDFQWVSESNAVSPYDFEITPVVGPSIVLDAKSTSGEFSRTLHVSLNELRKMVEAGVRYDVYRIYELSEDGAKLRIAEDVGSLAHDILKVFEKLPEGVLPDAISVDPDILKFGEEIVLTPPPEADTE